MSRGKKDKNLKNSDGVLVYSNTKHYSSETLELRNLFANSVVIIPYTLYYKVVKGKLPEEDRSLLDTYKSLIYEINSCKRNTSKRYDKDLVSFIKKLVKFRSTPDKLMKEICDIKGSKHPLKEQYKKFMSPENYDYAPFQKDLFKLHPLYDYTATYYLNLEKKNQIKTRYTELDERILEVCKQLWLRNYEKNHQRIDPVARDRFWTLARGLVINTIRQLYTIDIVENIPEIVDEVLGRVYEGLMCFFDPNYKVDTFIYTITMSKISAYERARVKKEDAPELFHNMDETDTLHKYQEFSHAGLTPILSGMTNVFLERHQSWNTAYKELVTCE